MADEHPLALGGVPVGMRICFFGTYDERQHPRVRVLREGLIDLGHQVEIVNVPLRFSTAARVRLATQPWRAPLVGVRLLSTWARLLWRSRKVRRPDVVVVGYMGHVDVHLARLRWRQSHLVLDYMVSLADTVKDRGVAQGPVARVLRLVDRAATRRASTVVLDTPEQIEFLPKRHRPKAVVVPVGAPRAWFEATRNDVDHADGGTGAGGPTDEPLRVAFFGLYTPLQGAPTIGEAIAKVGTERVQWTMVGAGQERQATEEAAGDAAGGVTWLDWVDSEELPRLVATHDVCLGIFGTSPKALRVVPNKVFQGAAAGCAVITSDTVPQRESLGEAALYVPPGDATALADTIARLIEDRDGLRALRRAALKTAEATFMPAVVATPLSTTLTQRRGARPDADKA